MISQQATVTLRFNSPFRIWVIDDFLEEVKLNSIIQEIPALNAAGWNRGHQKINGIDNILEVGILAFSPPQPFPPHCQSLIDYVHQSECLGYIREITGVAGLQNDESRRWSGLRKMIPGGFQLIHSDARTNPQTGYTKAMTCLLYLNKDFHHRDGGLLEIWPDSMEYCSLEISPIYNRLVVFENTDTSYHGVPANYRDRDLITWSLVSESKTQSRNFARFVRRPCDPEQVDELGLARSQMPFIPSGSR
jgi:hypothetical protein